MRKFIVMIAVATFVVFQGFAQDKVNPWLRGDDNKSTEAIRSYWLDGIAPQGIVSTLPHSEIVRAIEQSFGNAGIKESWKVVVARSKCIDPPMDLKKRTIRFWGSLGGKAKLMEEPRGLRKDEEIFVDPETNFILGGCQCANLLDVPMEWSTPLCLPETTIIEEYSSFDDPAPPKQKKEQTINTTVEIDPLLFQGQGSGSSAQPATASASATSDSGSRNRSNDECSWCGTEDRDGYIRTQDIRNYLKLRDEDVHATNDEYIRVKKAESDIRRDDMINMLIAKSMCNDCQPTGRTMQYENTEYYEVQQRGSKNEWLAPALGGLVGGFAGSMVGHLVMDNRTGRPMVQQFGGWQQQPYYGPRTQPPLQQQIGWEQTVGNNGWNSNGAVGLGGFVPNNGR